MSAESSHNAIRLRFNTEIASPESLTTIYDNEAEVPPLTSTMWCRLRIITGETELQSVGDVSSRLFRTVGIMYADLHSKYGSGDGYVLELADKIVEKFRCVTAGGIVFRSPSVMEEGIDQGGYWRVVVRCPFYYDILS